MNRFNQCQSLAGLLAVLGACGCSVALAQEAVDPMAAANFGSLELTGNFSPDPQIIDVIPGGSIDAATVQAGCNGFVTRAPDLDLRYTPTEYVLSILVDSAADTTLLVNTPSGKWVCNDDASALGNTNPGLMFDPPEAGLYNVWVGTFSDSADLVEARIVLTEQAESRWDVLDWEAIRQSTEGALTTLAAADEPFYGTMRLETGFSPDPRRFDLSTRGSVAATDFDSACSGFVGATPDYRLDYTAGTYVLSILAVSDVDTTLMVKDPDGRFHCSDDSEHLQNGNPGIVINPPGNGSYDIWVGNYSADTAGTAAQLFVSEIDGAGWAAFVQPGASAAAPETQAASSGLERRPAAQQAAAAPVETPAAEPEPAPVAPEPELPAEPPAGQIQYRSKR